MGPRAAASRLERWLPGMTADTPACFGVEAESSGREVLVSLPGSDTKYQYWWIARAGGRENLVKRG